MPRLEQFSIRLKREEALQTARAYLDRQSYVIRDPLGTDYYFLCGSKDGVEAAFWTRKNEPERYPWVCLVTFDEGYISVNQEPTAVDELRMVRDFVQWILDSFDCRVEDIFGNDLTAACREDVYFLYQGSLPEASRSPDR